MSSMLTRSAFESISSAEVVSPFSEYSIDDTTSTWFFISPVAWDISSDISPSESFSLLNFLKSLRFIIFAGACFAAEEIKYEIAPRKRDAAAIIGMYSFNSK